MLTLKSDLDRVARALEDLPPAGFPATRAAISAASLLRVIATVRELQEEHAGLRERLMVLERERAAARGRNDNVGSPRDVAGPVR